jgi:O-antigen ligase
MGMFASTLALMVHSMGTISFLIVRIMMPFWVLTAMCVYVRNDAIAMHWARAKARRLAKLASAPAQTDAPKDEPAPVRPPGGLARPAKA